jgi:hypothetical protein
MRPPFANTQAQTHETQQTDGQGRSQTQRSSSVAKAFLVHKWDQHFQREAQGKQAEIWHQDPQENGMALRAGLSPAEAAITTQLRSRAIGLRAYLAKWGVPGIQPQCECNPTRESNRETVEHVILHCPLRIEGRAGMIAEAGTCNIREMLTKKRGIQAVSRWIFRQGILSQFAFARKLATSNDKPSEWLPFPFLEDNEVEEGEEGES